MSNIKTKKEVTPFQSAIIGGVAGAVEITWNYPVEYVKTVIQLDKSTK